ncbi:MAG: alpha-mannosidase, partial [Salinispira sp.]
RAVMAELEKRLFAEVCPLEGRITSSARAAIPRAELGQREWRAIALGESWGEPWGRAWFLFTGAVPAEVRESPERYEAHINIDAEGCVYVNGKPHIGLTHGGAPGEFHLKRKVPLRAEMFSRNSVEILVDASANRLFGVARGEEAEERGQREGRGVYRLREARVVAPDRAVEGMVFDMGFLLELALALPESSRRRRVILRSLNEAANVMDSGGGYGQAAKLLSAQIRGQGGDTGTEVVSVGHSHLDLAWLWPLRETRRKAVRTSATMLRMMERYSDYVFGFSQPQMYAWIAEDEPELFTEIAARVKEGRWECFGALWVEPDTNIPSYESLIRQCLYGKQYWKSAFGIDSTVAWLPDTFGFTAALPQILKGCGIDNFITIKLSWNERNAFPYHAFQWEGIDGSRVNAHILPTHNYNFSNTPAQLREADSRWEAGGLLDSYLNLYGIGDGGGGPSIEHIEYARRAADCEGLPRVTMTGTDTFFRALRSAAPSLPVWKGELYLELHRGTYTTQAEIKRLHALIELALHNLEAAAVLYRRNPPPQLESWWKILLLHEFHDILPGSSIHEVYVEAKQTLASLLADVTGAIQNIFDMSPPPTEPATGNEPASAPAALTLVNTRGMADSGWVEQGCAHIAYDLPPFSHAVFNTMHGELPGESAAEATESARAAEKPKTGEFLRQNGANILTNGIISLRINARGDITSLRDERNGRELLEAPGARFLLWKDKPFNWDAWDVPGYYRETSPEEASMTGIDLIFNDTRGIRLKLSYAVGKSPFTCLLTLRPDSPRINIDLSIDWQERRKMLRLSLPTSIRSSFVNCGIQGGYVQRSTLMNNSWEQAHFEEPVHRFADISDARAGLALFAFAKYGFHFSGSLIDLNLLRSPIDPDPEADVGTHSIRLGLYCHNNSFHESDVIDIAEHFHHPPLVLPGTPPPALQPIRIACIDSPRTTLRIRSLKPAESGAGSILRIAETRGCPGSIRIALPADTTRAQLCNYLEEPLEDLKIISSEIELSAAPFEVRTVLLT